MRIVISVLCLCTVISVETSKGPETVPDAPLKEENISQSKKYPTTPNFVNNKPKIEFPSKETDASTPILVGDDPKKSNLPPRIFPKKPEKGLENPTIISGLDTNLEINHMQASINESVTNKKLSETIDLQNKHLQTPAGNSTKLQNSSDNEAKANEQEDMLHSNYKGGQDVDELHPGMKVADKDENTTKKQDPNSEVVVNASMDKKGPISMNETKVKSRESMLESTSKMMAVSSSVLANTQHDSQSGLGQTVVSFLLTAVALICLGVIGLLVWKRITLRKFGRDVLINEDDFDEVADMHTFDRAQIQIT